MGARVEEEAPAAEDEPPIEAGSASAGRLASLG